MSFKLLDVGEAERPTASRLRDEEVDRDCMYQGYG